MISIKQPKSLKMKLVLYISLITIVPSILISIFYYYYSRASLKSTMLNNAEASQAYIIDNVDNQLKLAIKLSDSITLNRTFEKLLTDSDLENYSELIDAKNSLDSTVLNSSIVQNVSSIIISGNNGVDLRAGNEASFISKEKIYNNKVFHESIHSDRLMSFTSIIKTPSAYIVDEYVIPIVRPILHSTFGTNIGWSFIGLKETLISDAYKEFYKQNKNPIYIVDNEGKCVSSTDNNLVGKTISNENFIKPVFEGKTSGHYDYNENGNVNLIVYSKLKAADWTMIQKISYSQLDEQNSVLLRMAVVIFLGTILITFIFTMFLSSNLTKPLKRILGRMRIISKGNFDIEPSLNGDDEMGELGRGINDLASNVNNLLKKVKQEEREKRNLELMVLQNQINPHFLYNTLNSIKWMATVQKADGIRDIVSALGRLLMNISKEKSEEVSIRTEFSLTEDYIFIQNIRYNGKIKISYSIMDESLLENKIVKFTLQPIVENAIFHGIEPKREAGNIKIGIESNYECILISVQDDGVGIDEENIKNIFNSQVKTGNRGLNGIGIKNVDERLKLFYGDEYGLTIDSIVGEYTRVNIRIPKI